LYDDDGVNIGEAVRNVTFYEKVVPNLGERQQMVFEIILAAGDKGISTKDIQRKLSERFGHHIDLNFFSGRLTELCNPKRYIKKPYCNPPLIERIEPDMGYDCNGHSHFYNRYRVRWSISL